MEFECFIRCCTISLSPFPSYVSLLLGTDFMNLNKKLEYYSCVFYRTEQKSHYVDGFDLMPGHAVQEQAR